MVTAAACELRLNPIRCRKSIDGAVRIGAKRQTIENVIDLPEVPSNFIGETRTESEEDKLQQMNLKREMGFINPPVKEPDQCIHYAPKNEHGIYRNPDTSLDEEAYKRQFQKYSGRE